MKSGAFFHLLRGARSNKTRNLVISKAQSEPDNIQKLANNSLEKKLSYDIVNLFIIDNMDNSFNN